jgi:tRNA A-37 threonylcarbamoyl transferase component Bud32
MRAAARIRLAADSALPQRDLLLDIKEVARRFSAQLGSSGSIRIESCERLRVKYSPGASLRALHRIQIGDDSYLIAARAFTGGRSKSVFERASKEAIAKKTVAGDFLLPVARDAELDAVYWTFPNDRKITKLSTLANPPESLSNICGRRWTHSRVVAYAPEKCVTAECLSDKDELLAYVKIYSDDEQPGCHVYQKIAESIGAAKSGLRVPRVLAYSKQHRALLLEPIAGRPIADLDGAERAIAFRRLGAELARLSLLPVSDSLPRFKRVEPDNLREAARIIGLVRPDVARLAVKLAEQLSKSHTALTDSTVWLHGDAHPKNGIFHDNGVTLVDMDQAGTGAAAADVGSLLAALRYLRSVGTLSPADERWLASQFLSGYSEESALPERASLRWHMAAALLSERALRAVSRIRPEGLNCMDEILSESWKLATEGDYE